MVKGEAEKCRDKRASRVEAVLEVCIVAGVLRRGEMGGIWVETRDWQSFEGLSAGLKSIMYKNTTTATHDPDR